MNKKDYTLSRIVVTILSIILLAAAAALTTKVQIGLAPWDALAGTLSEMFDIKFGYGSMIANSTMIILQLIILKKAFKKSQWLQIPVMLIFGYIINFFLYDVYTFEISSYVLRMIIFIIGLILLSIAVALLVRIHIITMPPEAFSKALSLKTKLTYTNARTGLDIVVIIFCTIAYFIFPINLQIREGTIITMVIFNFVTNQILKRFGPMIDRI